MTRIIKIYIGIACFCLAAASYAGQVRVDALRYWEHPEKTRMVFDVTGGASYKVFLLDKPFRVVIDFKNAKLHKKLRQPDQAHALFKRIVTARRGKQDLRVVAHLKSQVKEEHFVLKPSQNKGNRVVVDLFATTKTAAKTKPDKPRKTPNKAQTIVVAIDAGHGGEDPGAHGPRGTQEKKVVLAIAKKLATLINQKAGMKAVLVRKGDYYIKLRKRIAIAQLAAADLFISIHADAFANPKARGASVFTVSNRGASSAAAKALANRENKSDLVGGVRIDNKEKVLAGVLVDLMQDGAKEGSYNVAKEVLRNFKRIGRMHKNEVQRAGFMVLKGTGIPSILVETAFISNPSEEKKLRSRKHRDQMARAIFNGTVSYFKKYPPPNTIFANNHSGKHTIARGDTLSGIAQRYAVSMRAIKTINSITGDTIRIGQVLKIPRG